MAVILGQFGDHFSVKHHFGDCRTEQDRVDMSLGDWGR